MLIVLQTCGKYAITGLLAADFPIHISQACKIVYSYAPIAK